MASAASQMSVCPRAQHSFSNGGGVRGGWCGARGQAAAARGEAVGSRTVVEAVGHLVHHRARREAEEAIGGGCHRLTGLLRWRGQ